MTIDREKFNTIHGSFKEKVAELENARSELKKILAKNAIEYLEAAFEDIFSRHVGASAFLVTGYTPYFNDGDECTFSMGVDAILPEDTDYDDQRNAGIRGYNDAELVETAEEFEVDPANITPSAVTKATAKALAEIEKMEDLFVIAFENHFKILAFRDVKDGKVVVIHKNYQDHD